MHNRQVCHCNGQDGLVKCSNICLESDIRLFNCPSGFKRVLLPKNSKCFCQQYGCIPNDNQCKFFQIKIVKYMVYQKKG